MARVPISEISHDGKMNEDADYVLTETKAVVSVISDKLEKSLSIKDIQPMIDKIETLVSKKDFMELVADYNTRVVNSPSSNEITSSLSVLSTKLDGVIGAITLLAQKLDDENVTDMDIDYETTIKTVLK